MTKPITLSIFFPAYNEAANIQETLLRTIRVVEESPYIAAYEIIVVDDGSTDPTCAIAERVAMHNPHVRVICHETNQGYGASLKTGLGAATMEYVFFTDSDLQFDIKELQNLLIHLASYRVVIGYRAPRKDPWMRLVIAKGWNVLNRLLFGLKVRDIDCAFKIFKREDIQSIQLHSKGAMISAETLIRLSRKQVPVKEVPVSHLPRTAGVPTGAKPSVILRAFGEMLHLYWSDLGPTTHKEVLKFMTVGVVNTLVDIFIYIALTRGTVVFADHLVAAKFFSFLAGTVSSLILNRSWTFGLKTRLSAAEVIHFYAMTSLSIVINVALMDALVGLGMYDLMALVITTLCTFGINFTLSKFWVFKKPAPRVRSLISSPKQL